MDAQPRGPDVRGDAARFNTRESCLLCDLCEILALQRLRYRTVGNDGNAGV